MNSAFDWVNRQLTVEGPKRNSQVENLVEVESKSYAVAVVQSRSNLDSLFPGYRELPEDLFLHQDTTSQYFEDLETFPRLFQTEDAVQGLIEKILDNGDVSDIDLAPILIENGETYGGLYFESRDGFYDSSIFYKEE